MKKCLMMFLSMLLVVSLFVSCVKGEGFHEDDGLPVLTLALRDGIYSDVISECVKQFEEEEKVHCKILELSEDELHTGILENAANKEGEYDLCMVDGSWMAECTDRNVLANLTESGYEIDDDIISETTKVCYHDGQVYLAPYYGNVTVLLYNKAIVQNSGYAVSAKTTLEDLLKICQKAKEKGNLGFMYRGDTTNNYVVDFLPILSSFGGWVVDENNKPTVNTPEFAKALEFYQKLIATGKAENRDSLIMAIANNAAAMAVGWPGWYTPGKKSTADYCAFSGMKDKKSMAYNANVYGIWTLGIPANTPRKDLSVKLLRYLMDPEVQKKTVSYGGVPCRYSSLKDKEILKEFPQYEAVCTALEGGIYRPIMVEWPKFYEILGNEIENILDNRKSIHEGLEDAQKTLEEMLRN